MRDLFLTFSSVSLGWTLPLRLSCVRPVVCAIPLNQMMEAPLEKHPFPARMAPCKPECPVR